MTRMERGKIMKFIIDRFEGNYAICECEDMKMINISKDLIPSKSREGDVLCFDGHVYLIDNETTKRRKEHIEKLMKDIWAD
jgi:hypothetical protein